MSIALACSALVLASFAMFARDQWAGASTTQQRQLSVEIGQVTPGARPVRHGAVRRAIDGAATRLLSPFQSWFSGKSAWYRHIAETLLALALYGFGLGFVARWTSGRARPLHQ